MSNISFHNLCFALKSRFPRGWSERGVDRVTERLVNYLTILIIDSVLSIFHRHPRAREN